MQKPNPHAPLSVDGQHDLRPLIEALNQADPILEKLPRSVQIFCVGGAVRDALMGHTAGDRDFVVVGASVAQMVAAGFTPVGKDFPVFLHPIRHEEFALARTERKTAAGYKGFAFHADPSVSLEEDLMRRDLTVNAIALGRDGQLVDPHGGLKDLHGHVLRHIGAAFSEDPVRLLRLSRFAARWPAFSIAPETLLLCKDIVASGETRALVAERVWQELARGLMEARPSRMIDVLEETGAWSEFSPQMPQASLVMRTQLDRAANASAPLEIRYGLLMRNSGGQRPLPESIFKVPRPCHELAGLLIRSTTSLHDLAECAAPKNANGVTALLEWLMQTDVQRRPERFGLLLDALQITDALPSDRISFLRSVATLFNTPAAHEMIAKAVEHALLSGQSAADGATLGRLSVLHSHPELSSLV